MKNIKNLVAAVLVVSVIAAMVAIPIMATVYDRGVTVNWFELETKASATMTGESTNGELFDLYAYIKSNSTPQSSSTWGYDRSGLSSATTEKVSVSYPSSIPLVNATGRVYSNYPIVYVSP